ncbi:SAM-dependent methyltransferase [Corallococcus exiguus]|nr:MULTISPECIES: methyltransferase [Corallococcus]NNB88033.1 SAM-dependent methyltransferase [Corallococcus exiguus]NNB94221.1 SAM-dependent methyltransferase [Corallococcus exiguus]NNC06268.1 SAM-dependent methyltransferase [Corallococcus exiguus]NPC49961.1 SAM-dependent methyltransferase [Corallococcus exiguus]RKH84839.1 SAM-dependent methyltransferase [Corallococcus sp. AB032C]
MENMPGESPSPTQQLHLAITSYWRTQVIGTVARLGIADLLEEGARDSDSLATQLGVHPDALFRLMRAGLATGIFVAFAERTFALTPMGEGLCSNVPGSLRELAIIQASPSHWLPWGRLPEAIRTGSSPIQAALGSDIWAHFAKNPDEAEHFARSMGDWSEMVASQVARHVDFSPFARVADIGGSHGDLLAQVLRAHPSCRGILFELPQVAESAKPVLESRGIASRVDVVTGNFFEPGMPAAEAYLLKHILHDWEDDACSTLLRRLHEAAPAAARLFVVEMVIPDNRTPDITHLMDLNMLVVANGRERTYNEFQALLSATGWKVQRLIPTQSGTSILEVVKA